MLPLGVNMKNNIKNKINQGDDRTKMLFLLGFSLLMLLHIMPVYAHCPLCTGAMVAGVTVARIYGVDDAVLGLWIGALIVSTALWFNRVVKRQYIPFQGLVLSVIAFLFTVIPMYYAGIFGGVYATIFGIDKMLFGMVAGGIALYIGIALSNEIKKLKGRTLFPFQTIAIVLLMLIVTSSIFLYATG